MPRLMGMDGLFSSVTLRLITAYVAYIRLDLRRSVVPPFGLTRGRTSLLYVALGDSITYGYESTTVEAAYVRRFVKLLSKLHAKERVNLYLHAKPGWTSKQLLKAMKRVPECIWDEAKLITLMIGGNDMLHAIPWLLNGSGQHIYKVSERLKGHVEQMVELVQRPHSTLILCTLYNPFPESMLAESYMDTLNRAIRSVAEGKGLRLLDVQHLYRKRENHWIKGYKRGTLKDMRIKGNPIHPNNRGHAAIANALMRVYRSTQQSSKRRPSVNTGFGNEP